MIVKRIALAVVLLLAVAAASASIAGAVGKRGVLTEENVRLFAARSWR